MRGRASGRDDQYVFELLPGTGVLLPHGAGTLHFGTAAATVREALACIGTVRSDGTTDAAWTHAVRWGDLALTARTGTGGPALEAVVLARAGHGLRGEAYGPAGVPVVLDGVDLFGYPAAEVLEALGADPYPELVLQPAEPGGYLPAVTLLAEPPVRAARADEPDVSAYEDMWTTGRDDWQLEPTGSGGYLVVRKGDPPMDWLICHDTLAAQIIARMLAAGVEVVPGPDGQATPATPSTPSR